MATKVAGEMYYELDGQLIEIKRQLRQLNGYPFNPDQLKIALQNAIEGKFGETLPKQARKPVLNFREEISVGPLAKCFVRREFFKTREGLYLWNDMERVLSNTRDAEPTKAVATLRAFDLAKDSYDREIKAELPEHHEVELWQIAELIERQKNGESGALLNNDYLNIFYVAGFAVRVYWHADDREWGVGVWHLGGGGWRGGGRVFSSN